MFTQSLFQKLTLVQRKTLIDHVASPAPVMFRVVDSRTVLSLMRLKLLQSADNAQRRLRATVLTALGREVACAVLAEYAEALIQAGAGRSPLEQLLTATSASERLQEMKKLIAATRERFEVGPQALETSAENTSAAG